jgi:hypothetical protein
MTTEESDSKIKLTHRKAFDEEFKRLDSSQLGQIREYLIYSHDFGRGTNEQLHSTSSGSLALLRDILRNSKSEQRSLSELWEISLMTVE